jgi:hypothetical protein
LAVGFGLAAPAELGRQKRVFAVPTFLVALVAGHPPWLRLRLRRLGPLKLKNSGHVTCTNLAVNSSCPCSYLDIGIGNKLSHRFGGILIAGSRSITVRTRTPPICFES